MNVNVNPKQDLLFNAFHLLFVIHTIQVGIGLPGVQRIVFKEAGHDAWISVIIAGIIMHIVIAVMIKTLQKYDSADLYGIHHDIYGNYLGKVINTIYIVYFTLVIAVIFRGYIEIIQAWLFPELSTMIITILGLFITIYGVLGGIRVVVGVSVISFFMVIWVVLLLYFPIQYADWGNLLPVFDTSVVNLLKGSYKMSLTLIGFEILYIVYPYVKEKEKAARYAHIGILMTTILNLALMVVAIVYFSGDQLLKMVWAVLSMFKIIQLPFIERFEIVSIGLWMLIILPNVLLFTWAASKGVKRVYGISQKKALYAISFFILIFQFMFKTRQQVDIVLDWVGNNSFYIVFVYPFILQILVVIKEKVRARRRRESNEG